MMDGRYRRDRDRYVHAHLCEESSSAERATKSRTRTADAVAPPPPRPQRVLPERKAPAINRDLKPGRLPKSSSDGRLEFMGSAGRACASAPRAVKSLPRDQLSLPPTPPVQTSTEHTDQPHQFDDSPPSRPAPEPQTRTKHRPDWTQSSRSGQDNVKTAPPSAPAASHRFSLDLESQDLDSDSESSSDLHLRKLQHHEWPPGKGETSGSFTNHSKPAQDLEEQNWYVGAFSRVEAEHALHLVNREGAFLVRDCSKNTTHEPLVLALFYDKRVFNIQIRFSDETNKYTLGTGLRTNDRFDSVTDIIRFHSIFPIVLIDGRRSAAECVQHRQCVLMYPITKEDLTQLLN
ncbi:cytokine-dependent hematopoietic cell linker isoform X1 [Danio rerio]|uniref:Cytokine-dependent hematopoietic cell linker isoform X1 n=1 Tax=Danio rerio TaxID=7955 RepID=A0A8M3AZH5_DANRE